MNTSADTNGSAITQLMFENRLVELLQGFDTNKTVEFLNKALTNDQFGKDGHYTHECKACGGYWSFPTKVEVKMFRILHDTTQCSFEWKKFEKKKNWGFKRSNDTIPPKHENSVKKVIDELLESKKKDGKNTTAVLSTKQTAEPA